MTLADAGNTSVSIYGPGEVARLLEASRYVMKLPDNMLKFDKSHSDDNLVAEIVKSSEVSMEKVSLRPAMDMCCYIGHTPELAGKFDIKRAQQYPGLEKKAYGELKRGQCVTLADGTVVRPVDVLEAAEPSSHFAVLGSVLADDEELVQQLICNKELNK